MINWLIVSILVVLTGFNIFYLFYFKSKAEKAGGIEEKDNYYKLDAKIELLKYLSIGLISIATLFGVSKFTDISEKFDKFEDLEKKYNKLMSDYETLQNENDVLSQKMIEMKELFSEYELVKKDLEIEFIKQNQKIKEVTRKIPENNVRVLTKLLVETYIRSLSTEGRILAGPSNEFVKSEANEMEQILKMAGYSSEETKIIINDIKASVPWIYK